MLLVSIRVDSRDSEALSSTSTGLRRKLRPLRTADAVSDRLRTISGVGEPTSRADVEFERTGVGGVGLLIKSGAVVRGG